MGMQNAAELAGNITSTSNMKSGKIRVNIHFIPTLYHFKIPEVLVTLS
jgi:hypothetical protein